jgi:hypothetical protein
MSWQAEVKHARPTPASLTKTNHERSTPGEMSFAGISARKLASNYKHLLFDLLAYQKKPNPLLCPAGLQAPSLLFNSRTV